jgi:dTDP-4-dehydrorhamnose reductase
MPRTYAIIGGAGQLGRDLARLLAEQGEQAVPLTRAQLDLTTPAHISRVLDELRPSVVINCAAYNYVDRAQTEPEAAFAVNALAPFHLAQACRDRAILLVHFSTDYVFGLDTTRQQPYRTTDPPGPVSVYGASKLAGEALVRAVGGPHLIIRTCGLYGVHGTGGKGGNFVETMLRLAGQGKPLRVVNDQHCTPSYTVDVARATLELLATGQTGLFHVVNSGDCTWYAFAQTIFRLAGVAADLTPIPSSEYPTPARRPSYSVLATDALEAVGVPPLRPWPDALAAYLLERQQHTPAR